MNGKMQTELELPPEKRIVSVYFSPTKTTKKLVSAIAEEMSLAIGREVQEFPLTLPSERKEKLPVFSSDDILVIGVPVYAGRIPAILEETFKHLKGAGNPAVAVAVYGNRDYDDALLELSDILKERGFSAIGAGAFVGEHSLSDKVAGGRPDTDDLKKARAFGKSLCEKLKNGMGAAFQVKGKRPYKERPPAHKCAPKTRDNCTDCMVCAKNCPAGVISLENPRIIADGCLRCCACVKICPQGSKYFDDEMYVKFKGYLEQNCMNRKEPEIFL